MTADTYLTVAAPAEGIYREKGSKFLAFAFPVASADEVKGHLARLRKEYFDARHHCYAYILGPRGEAFRAVDDGEPSGTGGRPIHGQLLSAGLTDTLVVVVRYFGGVLLGASGLANAYRAAARDAIAHARIEERTIDTPYLLRFPYESTNDVMRLLKDLGLKPGPVGYDEACSLEVGVRLSLDGRFREAVGRLHAVVLAPGK